MKHWLNSDLKNTDLMDRLYGEYGMERFQFFFSNTGRSLSPKHLNNLHHDLKIGTVAYHFDPSISANSDHSTFTLILRKFQSQCCRDA